MDPLNQNLQTYSIMPLDLTHLEEICADIRAQYESGVATCALFSMTLVPEGTPPVDKVGALCAKYRQFQQRLRAFGIPSGVLIQASIGHGYPLGAPFPFQPYIALEDGQARSIVCPYDEAFRKHFYHIGKTIAETAPDCIMLDDDFRLINRKDGHGCACPLHLKQVTALAGKPYSREEIKNAAYSKAQQDRALFDLFVRTQRESLVDAAKELRAGIDSVDPTIPGIYCCVGNNAENADAIAPILAGAGNPSVVRINNGHYCKEGTHNITYPFFRAAAQSAKLRGKVDLILAETDTCPQNRYSTSASSLHTHFTGSILEGARGAKHWLTRLSAYEPQSGIAYRRILAKHRGFYQTLAEFAPQVRWCGFRIPVCNEAIYQLGINYDGSRDRANHWCSCVLERLGLPLYFSAEDGGILCLEGETAQSLTDSQVRKALAGAALLASDAAEDLIERGFGDAIGAAVRSWSGKPAKNEQIYATNQRVAVQMGLKELVPAPGATIDSMVLHTLGDGNFEELFPGALIHKNAWGGIIFLFAGTPKAEYKYTQAFSFLNYSRKQQLIRMAAQTDQLPAYYPGDEEVYFRAGHLPDGRLLCALFNIGQDPIEQTELVLQRKASKIQKLMPNGTWQPLQFSNEGTHYFLDTAALTLNPLILIIE